MKESGMVSVAQDLFDKQQWDLLSPDKIADADASKTDRRRQSCSMSSSQQKSDAGCLGATFKYWGFDLIFNGSITKHFWKWSSSIVI